MKRSPLRRDTPKAREFASKRSRLPARSKRKTADDREFAAARIIVLERDDHTCRLPLDGHHCAGGLHVHHRLRRSQGGSNDPSNLVTLCAAAHDWVHTNPSEAALFGLLILNKGN